MSVLGDAIRGIGNLTAKALQEAIEGENRDLTPGEMNALKKQGYLVSSFTATDNGDGTYSTRVARGNNRGLKIGL